MSLGEAQIAQFGAIKIITRCWAGCSIKTIRVLQLMEAEAAIMMMSYQKREREHISLSLSRSSQGSKGSDTESERESGVFVHVCATALIHYSHAAHTQF
jgi:hypothetical protein